jgi:hypothetical protein
MLLRSLIPLMHSIVASQLQSKVVVTFLILDLINPYNIAANVEWETNGKGLLATKYVLITS